MRKHALLITLGLLVVLLFVGNAAKFYRFNFVQFIDAGLYDYRLRLILPGMRDDRIVILDIDEKSLKEEGHWPWGRDRLALLMDKLFDHYAIAVLGFDIVFAEKDTSSGCGCCRNWSRINLKAIPSSCALTKISPLLEYDKLFADKIRNRKVVLGYYFSNSETGTAKSLSGVLPEPVFDAGTFKGRPITFTKWDGYGANLPELQASANRAGHFNPLIDFDGVVRRIPMIIEHGGAYYESLSLAVVRAVLDNPKLSPGYANSSK